MIRQITQKIDKKYRFAAHALAYAGLLYSQNTGIIPFKGYLLVLAMAVVTGLSVYLIHFPNVNFKNLFMAFLLPMNLALGGTLALMVYPNVSFTFKIFAIGIFSLLDYIILLIDNIFLVVEGREELIPLYRVAVTWSLILQIVVYIPLVSSVYKFNLSSFWQALIVASITFFYSLYQIWVTRYDKDAKNTGVVERLYLSFLAFFIVFASVTGVSFVPSESFLKSLFTSSVAMFCLSYVSAYLKNEINKKFIFQYVSIIVFFLLLMLVFRP